MFGHGPAGSGPFGHIDWARRVLWGSVPDGHRRLDADGLYRSLYESIEAEAQRLMVSARQLPAQRDGLLARDREVTEVLQAIAVEGVSDVDFGDVWKVSLGASTVPQWVAPGWRMRLHGAWYRVVRVVSYRDTVALLYAGNPNQVWVAASGVFDGVMPAEVVCEAPSVLEWLGLDVGVLVDEEDPAFVRRGVVARAAVWRGIKASGRSYRIRGSMSGFGVRAVPYNKLSAVGYASLLPPNTTFVRDGVLYTTLDNRSVRFDEVAADSLPVDDVVLWKDGVTGTQSSAYQWAESLGTVIVLVTQVLTQAELDGYGLAQGWRVLCVASTVQLSQIADIRGGSFSLVQRDVGDDPAGTEFVLDRDELRDDVTGQWTVIVGSEHPPQALNVGVFSGVYQVRYHPQITATCDWARTSRMMVEMAPSADLLASGVDAVRATVRLEGHLRDLIPLHVRADEVSYAVSGEAFATRSVHGVSEVANEGVAPATQRFDVTASDAAALDTSVRKVSGVAEITP